MKVIITATPEVSVDRINSVVNILTKIKGPISFLSGSIIPESKLGLVTGSFSNKSDDNNLEFYDFFKVCDTYRFINNTTDDEFVVALTSIKNEKGWFSSFKNQNIFVYIPIWDELTPNNPDYAIAYQIIENVFQSLIKLNVEDIPNEPNIHMEPKGCINDFCDNEVQAHLKLKTADICNSCSQRAINLGISSLILLQIKESLEFLRKGLLEFSLNKLDIKPDIVKVNEDGTIIIGNNTIELDPLYKTLFVFFLINVNERFTLAQLKAKDKEIKNLYYFFKRTAETEPITDLLNQQKSFSDKKTKLKRSLEEQLGEKMAKHYLISRSTETVGVRQYHYHHLLLDDSLVLIAEPFLDKIAPK
jgi:hypothetical protein